MATLETLLLLMGVLGAWLLKRRGDTLSRQLEHLRREHAHVQQVWHDLDWVAQNLEEAVFLVDRDERIVFLNRAAKTLAGPTVHRGQSFKPVAWQLQIQPLLHEILSQRADVLAQTVVQEERAFQVTVRACPSQTRCAALIVVNEVTELQRLGRVRRDFVANISHELRTPVTTLRLLADTVSREIDPRSPVNEWLVKLQGQIDILHQLTNELMDLALIESGQMPIKLVDTPVTDLIAQVVELFRTQAERKEIAIQMEIPSDLYVLADPVGARRVLGNLVHNAIKFTPKHGQVIVRAQRVADEIEFQVTDNGIGIPARDVPRIFERFYRVEQARMPDEARGTGLGLAIAKHIVEGHGGRIGVTSIEGRGSTFYFTLPVGSAPPR